MSLVVCAGIDVDRVSNFHQRIQFLRRQDFFHVPDRVRFQRAHLHREVVRLDRIGHADRLESCAADRAQTLAADLLLVQRPGNVEQIVERAEILGYDRPRMAHHRVKQRRPAGNGRGMAHHAAHPGSGLARFVDHDLLAIHHRFAHGAGEVEPVQVLETLDIDTDGFDPRPLTKVGEHVAVGEIGLVAQGQHVARIEPGILTHARDHERPALAQHDGISFRFLLRLWQPLQGDKPGIIGAGMGNHAQAVGAEKNRAAAFLAVRSVNPDCQCCGGFPALFRFTQTAGNQHDRFHGVGLDDFVHDVVDRAGGDRHDQQIELTVERPQALCALDAVDLLLPRTNDGQPLLAVAAAHQVAQNDPPEIHAAGRDADDADRSRMNQLVDLVYRAGQTAGGRCAEFALRPLHQQALARLHRIQLQATQHEWRLRLVRRIAVCQRKQAFETDLELRIRQGQSFAFGHTRQLLIGKRAAEQAEKIPGVGQPGGSVDRGAILPEIAFVQLRIQPAQSGTEDHAEFARIVQADAHFDRG